MLLRSLDIELNSTETMQIELSKGLSVDATQPLLALDTLSAVSVSLTNASKQRTQVLNGGDGTVTVVSTGCAYSDLSRYP